MDEFVPVDSYKCIYAFTIPDDAHKGCIKVGDATVKTSKAIDSLPPNCHDLNEAARKRIDSYTSTAGVSYQLLHTELAVRQVKIDTGDSALRAFRDYDVQRVLENSGIHAKRINKTTGKEWFRVDLGTVRAAIAAVKTGRGNLSGITADGGGTIVFRPEQQAAIDLTIKQFKKSDHMLWNAKMRFGKTLSALEVVRRMGFKRTIIMTHRPVVDDGWYEDFNKIFGPDSGYIYGSKGHGNSIESLLAGDLGFVYFASIQDLRGSGKVGGKYQKNDLVFSTVWDCVIVDEAHEGTKTALGDATVKAVVKEGCGTKCLLLSGTPFNLLDEFEQGEVYTWDYVMEQEAKERWDREHFGDSNPYEELPQLRIYTYDLGTALANDNYVAVEDKAFNFAEFFRTEDGKYFEHEEDVRSLLNLMTRTDGDNHYPFSREEYRDQFRHTLWMVPGVKAASALQRLMFEHPVFGSGQFEILNVAGEGDEERGDALRYVTNMIDNAEREGRYTITLSCGRLTTGVTVREWTAVLMLAGTFSTSASSYLQTIFRVQSPCNRNGKVKDSAYVFDFAPDRTLKMVTRAVAVSAKAGKTSTGDREALGKFLNYCPVISIEGSLMAEYDAGKLLRQLKRAYAERAVENGFDDPHLYNDSLLKLDDIEIDRFNHLRAIVGETVAQKKSHDITVNQQGLTNEEYEEAERTEKKPKKDLSPEEKELLERLRKARDQRKAAISILAGISVRMPLLIFGADIAYEDEIDLKTFVKVVDDQSWSEFMPAGVTKAIFRRFEKYYDEDVFIAAGRRIRNIARYADTLAPMERTRTIAGLFSHFKNPDKETVLTPWRVVNMQLSDTLGGWDFFDETHTRELDEPRFVDRGAVTRRTFSTVTSKVLEINSKTGLYPLYVAYSLFHQRTGDKLDDMPIAMQQELWWRVVDQGVFVICKTPMAKAITTRTLVGYTGKRVNARFVKDLVNTLQNKPKQFLTKAKAGRFWHKEKAMEFSAVVGNPPYQIDDGGNNASAMPVYQHFVETAIDLNPEYVSMITPSRWFVGGKGLDDFRARMLADHHLSSITDFPRLYEPFPNVKIRGGISYFLWDRDHDGPCAVQTIEDGKPVGPAVERYLDVYDVLIRRNEAVPILEKVVAKGEPTLDARVSANKPFGMRTYFHGDEEPEGFANPVMLYGSQRVSWIDRSTVTQNNEWVDEWKVLETTVQGTSASVERRFLSKPIVAGPNTACTETYVVAGHFSTRELAENYATYLSTRFVRFLVSLRKSTQHASRDVYAFIPDLSYDHPWNDEMLYQRYDLSRDDIEFIEQTVIPFDE